MTDQLTLHFSDGAELPLSPGVLEIGRDGDDDALGPVANADALVRFCVDRRGVWLTVTPGAHGIHVNGRPVRRMAMLRVGDSIYIDGVEVLLLSARDPTLASAALHAQRDAGDPRVVLRGVGGQYHGRSFTLDRPRLVGSAAEADIRIDDPAFAERHARLELLDDGRIQLRDLGSADGTMVNGRSLRDAVLASGDQLVFDAHHRFVVEAPVREGEALPPVLADADGGNPRPDSRLRASARRLPWIVLAAAILAAALCLLLLFGSAT